MKYKEADLIFSGLTSDGEKISFIARSALRSKKRFGGGVLEPLHCVEGHFRSYKSLDSLQTLNEAHLIHDFSFLKTDYNKLELAFFMAALIDKLTHEGDVDLKNQFHLLGNSLKALEHSGCFYKLKLHFETKLLAYSGVLPPWQELAECLSHSMNQHEQISISEERAQALSNKMKEFVEESFNIRLSLN